MVGDDLILYNSFTGAIVNVPAGEDQPVVRAALQSGFQGEAGGIFRELVDTGIFVRRDVDEHRRARVVHEVEGHATDVLHLVVMPTEACNFRCSYCYETFPRGRMEPDIREGLKRYVARRARRVDRMSVSWFGGEPLTAPDVMQELSLSFMETCRQHDVAYGANISTNGYFLTTDMVDNLLKWNVRAYQVTLDGPAETHDTGRSVTRQTDTHW